MPTPLNTIRAMIDGAHTILDTAISDTPVDLVNRAQPGSLNTVGAAYAHAVFNQDMFYNVALQGNAPVSANGYAERLGLSDPNPFDWDMFKAMQWDFTTLQAYAAAVKESANTYLAHLTEAELSRTCQLFGRDMTVEDILALAAWHTAFHAGEIATLKGIGGAPGLPF